MNNDNPKDSNGKKAFNDSFLEYSEVLGPQGYRVHYRGKRTERIET